MPRSITGPLSSAPTQEFPTFCIFFSKSTSAHSIKKHLAQLDSTAAAIGATPNLMAETECTRDFGLDKSLKGVTECKITSLLVQSTSQFAHGPRPGPGRKSVNFALPALHIGLEIVPAPHVLQSPGPLHPIMSCTGNVSGRATCRQWHKNT